MKSFLRIGEADFSAKRLRKKREVGGKRSVSSLNKAFKGES